MPKKNAYSLFVDDVAYQRQARGEKVNKVYLFKELDARWRSLEEFVKQQYKDFAKSGANPPLRIVYNRADIVPPNPEPNIELLALPAPEVRPDDGPANPTNSQNSNRVLVKTDYKDIKTNALKRPRDNDSPRPCGITHITKRHKPGIPGWRNHEDQTTWDKARYIDIELYNCRKQCETLIASRRDRLITLPIYSFSVNVLCQDKEGEFLPIELTIYAYSLKDGKFKEPYHVLIDPGTIPNACYNISMDHKESHKISYSFEDEKPSYVRNDYRKIYKEMLDFTKDGERTLLLMDPRHLDQAKGVIEWLYKRASRNDGHKATGIPKPSSWSILPMVDFFVSLNNFARLELLGQSKPDFVLHYRMQVLLDNTLLDHNPSSMCEYHQAEEKQTKYCTRSCALRAISYLEPVLERIYQLLEEYQNMVPAINGPEVLQLPAPESNHLEIVPVDPEQSMIVEPNSPKPDEPEIFIEYPSDAPKPVITVVTPELRRQLKPPPKKKEPILIGSNSEINQDNPPDVY